MPSTHFTWDGLVPSIIRKEVMRKCQDYFDLILHDHACVAIRPSLIALGVWIYLRKQGVVSNLSEKELDPFLRNQHEDMNSIQQIVSCCNSIQIY